MQDSFPNHYERAFQNWLIDHGIEHLALNNQKAISLGHTGIKSFDFLLQIDRGRKIIAEVKGRTFRGVTLEKLSSMECWVTADDIDGLTKWTEIFGSDHRAVFIFAYKVENIDVDFDGQEIFDFDSNRYIFFCIRLEDYRRFMKRRSPKWRTVTLPADKFRKYAISLADLLRSTEKVQTVSTPYENNGR
jgi:hypothetical protein